MAQAVDIGETDVSGINLAVFDITQFWILSHSYTVVVYGVREVTTFSFWQQDEVEESEVEDGDEGEKVEETEAEDGEIEDGNEDEKIKRNWSVLKSTPQLRKSKVINFQSSSLVPYASNIMLNIG